MRGSRPITIDVTSGSSTYLARSLAVTVDTVRDIVAAGRARWKIENENNNTLKTKGDRFEHNFGHGQSHLSATLASLIILVYLRHTLLDCLDERLTRRRELVVCRRQLVDDIRALSSFLLLPHWSAMIELMIQGLQPRPP